MVTSQCLGASEKVTCVNAGHPRCSQGSGAFNGENDVPLQSEGGALKILYNQL